MVADVETDPTFNLVTPMVSFDSLAYPSGG